MTAQIEDIANRLRAATRACCTAQLELVDALVTGLDVCARQGDVDATEAVRAEVARHLLALLRDREEKATKC